MNYRKLFFLMVLVLGFGTCFSQTPSSKTIRTIANENDGIPVAMFMSDFHIGEVYGSVTRTLPKNKSKENYLLAIVDGKTIYYRKEVAELVNDLSQKLGKNGKIQYLVLLGDIFDMAIHNESDVMNLTHDFFNKVTFTKDKRTFISFFDNIIYLPGNHDHHVWKMLQEEYYISNHLQNKFSALPIPQQAIGLLDLKDNKMLIEDSVIFPDHRKNFISATLSESKKPVYIAYPNLYIKYISKNNNDGICVTHGHFFEPGWNKTALNFDKYLRHMNDSVYFSELEKNNSPMTEFSDYEVAQTFDTIAQGMSDLQFYTDPEYEKIYSVLGKKYPALFPIKMEKTSKPKDFDIVSLMKYPHLVDPYLIHTQHQMAHLKSGNKNYTLQFNKLVYGHTHVPCFNVKYKKHIYSHDKTYIDLNLSIFNTGGWVNINSVSRPNPMFLYQDGTIKPVFKLKF
jgi:predicted phosphodiesterase